MLIVVKSIQIVQEVYKNILLDSEMSYNTLVKYSNESANPQEEKQIQILNKKGISLLNHVKQAETSFLFNICVFAEFGNAKNNLILVNLSLFEHF